MRVRIHRGSREIGGSCVELESGGSRLLLDLGLPLDAEGDRRRYLPAVAGLDGEDPSLLGVMVSHSHPDHFGLLAHIAPSIPVGMGAAARRILAAAAQFIGGDWQPPAGGWDFTPGKPVVAGPFTVTPFQVDHSAYDAYALLVEADGKRLFYSGDFRGHGRKGVLLDRLVANPPGRIDVLLMEGSNLGRIADDEKSPTEVEIENQMADAFTGTPGLALVHASSQNIDRIVSVFKAAKRSGRRMVIDLYAAAILEATGKPETIPQSSWPEVALFVPNPQRAKVVPNQWGDLLTHHSTNRIYPEHLRRNPGGFVMLFRHHLMVELALDRCLSGARYIYSMWEGYKERESHGQIRSWLERHGIPELDIHCSGHATIADLKRLATAINPRRLVPIHSFMPERYPELFEHVEPHPDGEWWEA